MISPPTVGGPSKHPMRLATVGTLLLVYGVVFAKVAAILAAACCLCLAWHIRRQENAADPPERPAGPAPVGYPNRMRWVVRGALLLGITGGGIQVYRNLSQVGWSESAALVTSLIVAVVLGILLWMIVTVIFRTHQ